MGTCGHVTRTTSVGLTSRPWAKGVTSSAPAGGGTTSMRPNHQVRGVKRSTHHWLGRRDPRSERHGHEPRASSPLAVQGRSMIPSVRAIGGADTTKFEPLFADARWANLVFDATEVSGSKTYTVPTSLPSCRGKSAVVHWWVHGATCDTFRWCVAHTPALDRCSNQVQSGTISLRTS